MEFKKISITHAIELLLNENENVYLKRKEDFLQVHSIGVVNKYGIATVVVNLFNDDRQGYEIGDSEIYERKDKK